jgi:hypothetical protein
MSRILVVILINHLHKHIAMNKEKLTALQNLCSTGEKAKSEGKGIELIITTNVSKLITKAKLFP